MWILLVWLRGEVEPGCEYRGRNRLHILHGKRISHWTTIHESERYEHTSLSPATTWIVLPRGMTWATFDSRSVPLLSILIFNDSIASGLSFPPPRSFARSSRSLVWAFSMPACSAEKSYGSALPPAPAFSACCSPRPLLVDFFRYGREVENVRSDFGDLEEWDTVCW